MHPIAFRAVLRVGLNIVLTEDQFIDVMQR